MARYVDSLYCKIYVDADVDRAELIQMIAQFFHAPVDMDMISRPLFDVTVKRNEFFEPDRRTGSSDPFLYSRYYLDVEAVEGQQRRDQIALITGLLEYLWSAGYEAVPSCDYEDELPRKSASGCAAVEFSG